MKHELHEILLPVLVAVLVARPGHVLLGEEVVVGVLLLPLLLLPLLGDARLLLFLFCYSSDTRAPPDGTGREMKIGLTLASRAACSFLRSSRRWSSFSCFRSGCFSTLVLLSRLMIGFSRCGTSILLTCRRSMCWI